MIAFDVPLWMVLAWLFCVGSAIGSFLNVCIYRIPQHDDLKSQLRGLLSPPSSCPRCFRRIPATDNIPIFGWLKLGGRCRFCDCRISPRYPLIELFNGLLFVAVYWCEIPAAFGSTLADAPFFESTRLALADLTRTQAVSLLHWRYVYHMVLIEALVVATFIDFDLRIIPDGSTLPAMAVGVFGAVVSGRLHLVPLWLQDPQLTGLLRSTTPEWMHVLIPSGDALAWSLAHPHWHGLAVSLAGLVVGGGIVWVVRIIGGWVLQREAMGFGDVVLMALIGSFMGWQATIVVFFFAPLAAIAVVAAMWIVRRDSEIPYGPYLSLAAVAVLLGWDTIWPRCEAIFQLGPLLPVVGLAMAVMLVVCLAGIQLVKRMLGIPLYEREWHEAWTSADQLNYQAGENVDDQQGNWKRDRWAGSDSGRGSLHESRWRDGR